MDNRPYIDEARAFCAALRELAAHDANMENLESYLSHHFGEWLAKYANTPNNIICELECFAKMEDD